MIRLLHTSDWHLGRFLYGKSLIEDQAFALDRLVELIDRVKPHALLIAGDLFDRPLPPESAITLFDDFLNRIAGERRLPVLLIPGNHDSCERLGFASQLLRERGVTIFSRVEDAFTPIAIRGDNGAEALVYGIPFVEPVVVARALKQPKFETPDEATRALCRELLEKKTCARPAVLLCHAFVAGGEVSDSEKEIFIGGSSHVSHSAFQGFAYTALGHLHKPQRAGDERVRYSGSLLPYSKSEVGHEKAVLEIHLTSASELTVNQHSLPCLRDLRYVEGELAELIANASEDAKRDDYVIAGFTDKGAVLDAYLRLRGVYPNLLHVSRAGGYQPEESPALSRKRERESLSELELFTEFFHASTGADLDASERSALIEAIAELEREERVG